MTGLMLGWPYEGAGENDICYGIQGKMFKYPGSFGLAGNCHLETRPAGRQGHSFFALESGPPDWLDERENQDKGESFFHWGQVGC